MIVSVGDWDVCYTPPKLRDSLSPCQSPLVDLSIMVNDHWSWREEARVILKTATPILTKERVVIGMIAMYVTLPPN